MENYILQDSDSSEENEVFCYPASKSEVLRRFTEPTNLTHGRTTRALSESDTSSDSSVELIEAQSEPELLLDSPSPEKSPVVRRIRRSLSHPDLRQSLAPSTWETAVSEESFLATEALVTRIADSSGDSDLDNTLDKIEEILKAGSEKKDTNVTLRKQDVNTTKTVTPHNIKTHTPASTLKKLTPGGLKTATPIFKTPAKPNRLQKPICAAGRSPMRGPSPFKNIDSPVGFYIKNSPQAPLMQTVRPRRPLPGWSCIPKPVEHRTKANKENVTSNLLPPKAYVSAKETKLIMTPDAKSLPRNNQVKKMASALPHPTVMRHERREKLPTSKTTVLATRPDESFAKLSISQADLSVCVVKSAGITETLKRN